ncbi:MAG: Gfo/Idh/MocA family oxidoreductase [Anaerolineaceae bacterium]|nr:Gfo/Idh/MocA family oxidoreductase [Anaerolineaceae bacterium]
MRVGIVGAGFMGRVHAAGWMKTPAQIAGIYSIDRDGAAQLARTVNGQVYDDLDALIRDVDVVDICVPTHLHHDMTLRAAAAGKDVVCEKPLARTIEQAQAMIAACEQAGVKLLVGHVVRFFPQYALAKTAVDRGDVGNVGVVRLTRCSFQPRGTSGWFMDTAKSGGMMLDLMIHDFDYARWVAGEVKSVFAKQVRSHHPDAPGDYALAILRHEGGAISNIEGGWAYPPPLFRTALEIAGDRGLIEHPAGSSDPVEVHVQSSGGHSRPDIAVPSSPLAEDPYQVEIRHFYDILTGAITTPRVTAADGLAALQIALAAIESAQTGRPVQVKEMG